MSCKSVMIFPPLETDMACCEINRDFGEDAEERKMQVKKNKKIEKQIKKDKKEYQTTNRLLLLGASESGKSTIVKQMRILHRETPFNEEEKNKKKHEIRQNVKHSITAILQAMATIYPPVSCDDPALEERRTWLIEQASKPIDEFEYTEDFYETIIALWKDDGVQACFTRSNEYQLMDCAKYFLDKVDIIRDDTIFQPTEQDILRARVLTYRIQETKFRVDKVKFRMIDVGGQRGERRKWIQCFNDVTAIIFVTASSSYDMALREDSSQNRMRESLKLFKAIWNNPWLSSISIILFLNKQDILKEKITSGRSKLEEYFPEFENYVTPPEAKSKIEQSDVEREFIRAKYFIRDKFLKISHHDSHENMTQHKAHQCYPHFTCAIDTENIRRVFNDCRDIIQRAYLRMYEIM